MKSNKYIKKKKASTLIEAVVSIFIVLIMINIVVKIVGQNIKSLKVRLEVEEAERIVYCIMQEVKYNMDFEEAILFYNNNNFKYKLYDDLLSDLKKNKLNFITKGNDIIVDINEPMDNDKLKMNIKLYNNNNELISEREFIKYKWMDYYE